MFRRAVHGDEAELCRVANSAYRNSLSPSSKAWTTEAALVAGPRIETPTAEKLLREGARIYLAVLDEKVVGTVQVKNPRTQVCLCLTDASQVTPVEDAAMIGLLSVDPALQTAGIGKKLISHAEAVIRDELKLPTARMRVVNERHELIAFYERRGYKKAGEPQLVTKLSNCEELKEKFHFVMLEKNLNI